MKPRQDIQPSDNIVRMVILVFLVAVVASVAFGIVAIAGHHKSRTAAAVTKSECLLQTQTWWGHGGRDIMAQLTSIATKGASDATSGNQAAVESGGAQLTAAARQALQDSPPSCIDPHGNWQLTMRQFAAAGIYLEHGEFRSARVALDRANVYLEVFNSEAKGYLQ